MIVRAQERARALALEGRRGTPENIVQARVTLHAATPTALADTALAALIRACAQETAEIQGVGVPEVAIFDDRLELSGAIPMPILLAIAAEVRRSTGRWHLAKHGSPLWQGE